MEVSRYWRLQSQRYNLTGEICPNCSKKTLHKRAVCPHCAGETKAAPVMQVEVPAYPMFELEADKAKVFVSA